MESEEPEIKSKQSSKRDRTLPHQYCNMHFHEKNQHRLRLPLQHCHHRRRHHRHHHHRPRQGLLL